VIDVTRRAAGDVRLLDGVMQQMSGADCARLALLCIATAEYERRTAEEAERRTEIDLQDKRLLADLERMALDQLGWYPRRVADALRAAGWTVEPPA
jgi:hypothetical protein